jgi:aspartyl-tRNA(Asn)/glutamyl-tRNA(Gln) amidotransferase subunit A
MERGLSGLRIAYAPTLNGVTVDPLVSACVRTAVDRLADLGAVINEEEPPLGGAEASFLTIYGAAVARVISGLSAAQLDQVDLGLRAFATEGSRISIADYFAALKVREELTASLNAFFERYDALVLPMLPLVAFEAGELVPKGGAFPSWYDWTPFSGPFNLTKVPAASIPCGFVGQMPVGLQVVAPMFHENVALQVCRAYESVQPIVRPSGF